MARNALRTTMIAVLLTGALLAPASAAELQGDWLTEEGKATIRIADCGSALCGTIVATIRRPASP